MNAIRVLRHIDSDLVHIPELREMMGQDVEITIRARPAEDLPPLETMETFLGASKGPPASEEEMAELRALAKHDPGVAAALWLSERGGLDVEAILDMRNAERDSG